MRVLSLREVPEELMAAVKAEAGKRLEPMREFCLRVLGEAVGYEPKKGMASRPKREDSGQVDSGGAVEETPIEPSEARSKKGKGICPDCELPMRDWGTVWKCQHCRKEVKK